MPSSTVCPSCGNRLRPFEALDRALQKRLESMASRHRQSISHRRSNHRVCPECLSEIHGCGQPYVLERSETSRS